MSGDSGWSMVFSPGFRLLGWRLEGQRGRRAFSSVVWLELAWWTSAPSSLGQKTGPPLTSARLRLQATGQSRRRFLPGRAGVSPAWHGGWGFGWALRGGCFAKVSLVGGLQPFQALGRRRRRRKGTRSPCQPAWAPIISLLLPLSRTQQDRGIPTPFLQ